MPRIRSLALASALALAALLAPRPSLADWPMDPRVNVPVCSATGDQRSQRMMPDGAGGAFLAWYDTRSLPPDIFLQHLAADGTLTWEIDGVAMHATLLGDPYAVPGSSAPSLASDGAGGLFVAWSDARGDRAGASTADIYAQRVSPAGVPQWADGGVLVASTPGRYSLTPAIVPSAEGGALVGWMADTLLGWTALGNVHVQKLDANGSRQWGLAGHLVADGDVGYLLGGFPDGQDGIVLTWQDRTDYYFNGTRALKVQHVLADGSTPWGAAGMEQFCSWAWQSSAASDGAGGLFMAWESVWTNSLVMQHITASGAREWGEDGVIVSADCYYDGPLTLAADGTGGAVCAWVGQQPRLHGRIQRLSPAGAPLWGDEGVIWNLPPYAPNQIANLVRDGSGGVVLGWLDTRSPSGEQIRVQHLSASGEPAWDASGVALCTTPTSKWSMAMLSDGAGGSIVTWEETRSSLRSVDLYAQWIGADGAFPGSAPAITAVKDVPDDQGGRLRVRWRASNMDTLPALAISAYGVWRRTDASAAASAIAAGGRVLVRGTRSAEGGARTFRIERRGAASTYWECLGSVPARGDSAYTFLVATAEDSTSAGNPVSVFQVDAHCAEWSEFWTSAPDSGYSVDNLAPATPAQFSGQHTTGAARLHWSPSTEPDFAFYHLYSGPLQGFVPGPANRLAALRDTGYVAPASVPCSYALAAVDVHGNESVAASIVPTGTLETRPPLAPALRLAGVAPNPARGPSFDVAFALRDGSPARLELLDLNGRRLAALEVGGMGAGDHVVAIGPAGGLAPGIYWLRLAQGGAVRTTRAVAIE